MLFFTLVYNILNMNKMNIIIYIHIYIYIYIKIQESSCRRWKMTRLKKYIIRTLRHNIAHCCMYLALLSSIDGFIPIYSAYFHSIICSRLLNVYCYIHFFTSFIQHIQVYIHKCDYYKLSIYRTAFVCLKTNKQQ